MVSKKEIEDIWNKVKSNRKKLESCMKHDFEPIENKPTRYRCKNCGGEEDIAFVRGYTQGLWHGNPDFPEIKSEADKILAHLGGKNGNRD